VDLLGYFYRMCRDSNRRLLPVILGDTGRAPQMAMTPINSILSPWLNKVPGKLKLAFVPNHMMLQWQASYHA
jgi:hypothetical protein